jgi:hypothetical protein
MVLPGPKQIGWQMFCKARQRALSLLRGMTCLILDTSQPGIGNSRVTCFRVCERLAAFPKAAATGVREIAR